MAGTPQATPDDVLSCDRCHGFVSVEADGTRRARIRCMACGHVQELEVTDAGAGAWKVPRADGKTKTYDSWDKLVSAARAPEAKRMTGASLLERTPSHPHLATATSGTLSLVDSASSVAVAEPKVVEPKAEGVGTARSPMTDEAPPSADELDPTALVDDHSDDEPSPLSLRDAIPEEEDEPSPLSMSDAIVEDEPPRAAGVGAVGASDGGAPGKRTPERGKLRTLPPSERRDSHTPPPPTITFESEAAAAAEAPEEESDRDPVEAERSLSHTRRSADTRGAYPALTPAPKRSWLLPTLVLTGAVIASWRILSSPATPEPQPTPAATVAAPTILAPTPTVEPTPAVTITPVETAPAPSAPTPSALAVAPANAPVKHGSNDKRGPVVAAPAETDPAGPAEKKAPVATHEGLSMSEMLDRAGSARRSGDYAAARDLYQKVIAQNPGNVEANGGLGDVARAQGDMAGAKTSYERALATSPSYGPAQLGLADTEWDLGNRAAARRRYAQIVERLGERAPPRAKERGTAAEE